MKHWEQLSRLHIFFHCCSRSIKCAVVGSFISHQYIISATLLTALFLSGRMWRSAPKAGQRCRLKISAAHKQQQWCNHEAEELFSVSSICYPNFPVCKHLKTISVECFSSSVSDAKTANKQVNTLLEIFVQKTSRPWRETPALTSCSGQSAIEICSPSDAGDFSSLACGHGLWSLDGFIFIRGLVIYDIPQLDPFAALQQIKSAICKFWNFKNSK